MRIATAKQTYQADEALFDTRVQRLWLLFLAAALALFRCRRLLAVPGLSGGHQRGQRHRAEHPDRLHRAGQPGASRLHGPGRVHGGGAGAAAGHAGAAQPAGSRRGGDAGRAGGGRAVAAGEGLYLAISTIAASFIAHFIFANGSFTGGTAGSGARAVFGVDLDTSFRIYWLIVPLTALMVLGAANLFRTRIGRAFIAIRDRDISAEVLGIRLLR